MLTIEPTGAVGDRLGTLGLTSETVSGDELRPRDRPRNPTMIVEARCILGNLERAATVGTDLERQWRTNGSSQRESHTH
jgi:hypothetical protein